MTQDSDNTPTGRVYTMRDPITLIRNGKLYGDPSAAAVAIGGNPDFACYFVNAENASAGVNMNVDFFRIRTDAAMAWPGE